MSELKWLVDIRLFEIQGISTTNFFICTVNTGFFLFSSLLLCTVLINLWLILVSFFLYFVVIKRKVDVPVNCFVALSSKNYFRTLGATSSHCCLVVNSSRIKWIYSIVVRLKVFSYVYVISTWSTAVIHMTAKGCLSEEKNRNISIIYTTKSWI